MCGEGHEVPVLPADSISKLLYKVPDRLLGYAVAPKCVHFSHFAEDSAPVNPSSAEQLIQFCYHPVRNRNRSNVSSLT